MSHEIDMTNGRANFAFTGSRDKIWHGLGSELTPGLPIEVWVKEAGMDWTILESPVYFRSNGDFKSYNGKKVLYRSDTGGELSIVGGDYNIIQPTQVLEFFRDLIENNDMVLSTAGCLFGGRRFWALAETEFQNNVVSNDLIKGYLLLVTSADGTLSTIAKFVSERVVCNNTLRVALNESENGKNIVKKTHKSAWDANEVKINLGLLSSSWNNFISNLNRLSECKMTDDEVIKFIETTCYDPNITDKTMQPKGAIKQANELFRLYMNGAGADSGYGTCYGVLNCFTNYYTHPNRKRNPDRVFQSAYFDNDLQRDDVFQKLLELA